MEFDRIIQKALRSPNRSGIKEQLMQIIDQNDKENLYLFIALDQTHVNSGSLNRLQRALKERTEFDSIVSEVVMECRSNERLWKLVQKIIKIYQ
jgi:hypothetical protein